MKIFFFLRIIHNLFWHRINSRCCIKCLHQVFRRGFPKYVSVFLLFSFVSLKFHIYILVWKRAAGASRLTKLKYFIFQPYNILYIRTLQYSKKTKQKQKQKTVAWLAIALFYSKVGKSKFLSYIQLKLPPNQRFYLLISSIHVITLIFTYSSISLYIGIK